MKVNYIFTLLAGFLFGTLSLAEAPAPAVSTTTTVKSVECPENCVPKPTPKPKKKKKKPAPPAKPTAKDNVEVKTTVTVKSEEKAPVPAPVPEKPVQKEVKHHTLDLLLGKGPAGFGLDVYKTQDRYNEYAFQERYGWLAGLHYSYEFSESFLFVNRLGVGVLSSNPTTVFGSIGRSW